MCLVNTQIDNIHLAHNRQMIPAVVKNPLYCIYFIFDIFAINIFIYLVPWLQCFSSLPGSLLRKIKRNKKLVLSRACLLFPACKLDDKHLLPVVESLQDFLICAVCRKYLVADNNILHLFQTSLSIDLLFRQETPSRHNSLCEKILCAVSMRYTYQRNVQFRKCSRVCPEQCLNLLLFCHIALVCTVQCICKLFG